MNFPIVLEKKLERAVAIFGAGVSGNSVANFLNCCGVKSVIYDVSEKSGAFPSFDFSAAENHDLVVFSPGFPLDHEWLKIARKAGILCLTEIDFAAMFWQGNSAPISKQKNESEKEFSAKVRSRLALTAVTGTNGKTTLAEFLAFAHRKAGRSAVAVGNNGIPMSSMLPSTAPAANDLICEVSSFQAEALRYFSPGAILWTNFDEDHIERHGSLENYFRAKLHLIEMQQALRLVLGDFPKENLDTKRILDYRICIVGESVAEAAKKFGIALPSYVQIATRDEVKNCVPAGSIFETFPQMENYALAKKYWAARGFPLKELEAAATIFKAREHRLTKVLSVPGVPEIEFWNDSKGTNFGSVFAALETFPDAKIFWIGGGRGKGGDVENFVRKISAKIERAFLIGETAAEMKKTFEKTGVPAKIFEQFAGAISAAFRAAKKNSSKKSVILFSPGFASFDMFASYADRGAQFVQIVKELTN